MQNMVIGCDGTSVHDNKWVWGCTTIFFAMITK